MILSEGTTEKIPSDTTGDRSRDRSTSSAAMLCYPRPLIIWCNCTYSKELFNIWTYKLLFAAISRICKYGRVLHLSSGCDVTVLPGVSAGHLRSPTAQQMIAQIVCSHQNYKYMCQSSNRDTSAHSVAAPQMSARFGPATTQVAQRNTVHVRFVPNTVARAGCVFQYFRCPLPVSLLKLYRPPTVCERSSRRSCFGYWLLGLGREGGRTTYRGTDTAHCCTVACHQWRISRY